MSQLKRHLDSDVDDEEESRPAKVQKLETKNAFVAISDEILIRILALVTPFDLIICQRVCQRFQKLSLDPQLWKAAYYDRFILPRAIRIPNLKNDPAFSKKLNYTSRASKWLEDEDLNLPGRRIDWKGRYRLRYNWWKGRCGVSEIEVARRSPAPSVLVRVARGLAFTADACEGLRVWSLKGSQALLASSTMHFASYGTPTAIAVHSFKRDRRTKNFEKFRVALGFDEGHISIFHFDLASCTITCGDSNLSVAKDQIASLALSEENLVSMTDRQMLCLYSLGSSHLNGGPSARIESLKLVCSLRSQTVWPPLCLSLRSISDGVIASVAYAIPSYPQQWTVGLQELLIKSNGSVSESRLATALTNTPQSAHLESQNSLPQHHFRNTSKIASEVFSATLPTSISYAHPYMLAAHSDNTLILYLVTSTPDALVISGGTRLWGHTSSVSSAHVAGRGKAVSIGSNGSEVRLWELEGGTASSFSKRRDGYGEYSVQVQPNIQRVGQRKEPIAVADAFAQQKGGIGLVSPCRLDHALVTKQWVGFDDENVVILGQNERGSQALVVYDFT